MADVISFPGGVQTMREELRFSIALQLREFADAIESGKIEQIIVGYMTEKEYLFYLPCRKGPSLFLADLLHQKTHKNMEAP